MDQLERQLRDLAEGIRSRGSSPVRPTHDVIRRARLRRLVRVVGSSGMALLVGLGAYAGIASLRRRSPVAAGPGILAAAATVTEDAGSARIDIDVKVEGDRLPIEGDVQLSGEGVVDFAENKSRIQIELPGRLGGGASFEMIQIRSTIYMKDGLAPTPDRPWVRFEPPREAHTTPTVGGFLGMEGSDPSQLLDQLRSITDDIVIVGAEEVRGVRTTRYHATVDPRQAVTPSSGDVQEGIGESLKSVDMSPFVIDVWVDANDLVRRMSLRIGVSGQGPRNSEMDIAMTFVMELYDFGIDVEVESPPRDQITDVDDYSKTMESYSSGPSLGSSQTSGLSRRYMIVEGHKGSPFDAATHALNSGNLKDARHIARPTLEGATDPDAWNYGNDVHYGNLILGHVALRQGDVAAAKEYLLKAGSTPGSPQLNSFGPNMSLARDLLLAGERRVVMRYLDLCEAFWHMGNDQLKSWIRNLRAGDIPDFGPNLVYGGLDPNPIAL